MRSDGILGSRDGQVLGAKAATTTSRRTKWLKRRERWLVVLGIILHAVYMLSIFDIYFKTPIVHGMDPVTPRFAAPAKRLVLLVADGLRADKFFEPDEVGNYRAPFLRSIIKTQGRWGFLMLPSHRKPTYDFFGSPDIVPIFCGALQHSTWDTYPHEFEDFATDASFLDMWSLDKFQSLLNRSSEDPKLKDLLQQDNLVIFLHLLGYYFKDNRTAYIFTADHGMSDKGSHGDGHPSNTDTPLVAWGAGVKYPRLTSSSNHSDCGFRFVDDHVHDAPTPIEWGLHGIERVDVNQADIAPLMVSTLLGLPCPVNSVGSLPIDYINMTKDEEVEAVLSNTKEILNQFLRKSYIKQSYSLYFKPFKPLSHCSSILDKIEGLILDRDYDAAMDLSQNLRSLALQGLHYFQTYDWLMLMSVITLGYVGWMIYLVLHVLQSYTSLARNILDWMKLLREITTEK
ncbi:GPI ethanolamine phosphate transferase 1, C-terminal [Sesbania bispinosa]|nr:GPI ethanolamine phosphate transferase 1, C-terminal [Sesbania bispinosa]